MLHQRGDRAPFVAAYAASVPTDGIGAQGRNQDNAAPLHMIGKQLLDEEERARERLPRRACQNPRPWFGSMVADFEIPAWR